MKKVIGKKVLILLFLLLFLLLFSCFFLAPVNHAPVITSTPITTATVGELYIYDVEATDSDGDTLTCSLTTCPRYMTIDCETGVINWIPTSIRNKSHDVIVKVSDGELYDTQSFSITVSEAPSVNPPTLSNHAPVITSTPITSVLVDELYTYDVKAADSDNDILTYSLTTNPAGMTIDSVTGEISWTPISSQIGDNDVTVKVSDGEKYDTQSFRITVTDTALANHAPVITSTPITIVAVDEPYTYDVEATDSNNDILTYSLTTNPAGMTIDSLTGEISWTPISSQIGDNDVTVKVSDGEEITTQSFIITVYDILTSITVLPETLSLFVGQNISIDSIIASYNYGLDKTIALTDCSYSWGTRGIASVTDGEVTGVAVGSDTLTVSYTEGGVAKTATVEVTVNPMPPNLELLPHTQNAKIGESFSINVEVENVTDLLGASITLNFDHVAMPFLSATPGNFFSSAFVAPDPDPPPGSITLNLDSVEPDSGTGTIMIVSFIPVIKGNNYPITFVVTELRDKDYKIIVHTTGSGCKVHIKK